VALAGIEGDEWDANWLVVDGRVAPVNERAWEFRDPALLTWEVEHLSSWPEALASGQADEVPAAAGVIRALLTVLPLSAPALQPLLDLRLSPALLRPVVDAV
jgi:hypothetical protein